MVIAGLGLKQWNPSSTRFRCSWYLWCSDPLLLFYLRWRTSFFSWGFSTLIKNQHFTKIWQTGARKKISYQKRPRFFFPESFLTYSDRKSISVCCDSGGVDLSVCVCKASGNQSWMTLITGKFVEFPRLVARNLNMHQAPNLNGDCQAIYSQTSGEKTQKRYWPFFSEYCRPSPGNEGSKP